jgi:hypothetical protein
MASIMHTVPSQFLLTHHEMHNKLSKRKSYDIGEEAIALIGALTPEDREIMLVCML